MFLQVAQAAVDDCADYAAGFGAGGHQAAVDCVDGFRGGGDEYDGAGGDGVYLLLVEGENVNGLIRGG